jgi:hypothetical protein
VHVKKHDAMTLRIARQWFIELERQVCGSVAPPGFVGRDHCPALMKSECAAWFNCTLGMSSYTTQPVHYGLCQ